MIAKWIEMVNTEKDIHTFIDEEFLVEKLKQDDVSQLNWMKIFNSKIELSNEFIINNIDFIDWKWLTRHLSEPLLNRYARNVVQWNSQLYGRTITFEFLSIHRDRFDWKLISRSPPDWFTDLHYEEFGTLMDWSHLTKFSNKMDVRVILQYADMIDWEWITVNDIRDEPFARQFIAYINWDHPDIHTHNLSAEFLYKVLNTRKKIQMSTD